MLPNVRLMIATMFAAVLMLIFGFGMFATFRVNHAPLERAASASTLHLFTAQDAAPVLSVTAAAPFNNRFETVGPGSGSVAALAYAAPEPAEQPEAEVVASAADHPEPNAAQPAPEPTSPAVESADIPAQQAELSEAALETKPDEALAASTQSVAPTDPPTVALIEPPVAAPAPEPAQPPAHTEEADVSLAPPTVEPVRTSPDLTTNAAAEDGEESKTRANAPPPQTARYRGSIRFRNSGHLPNRPRLVDAPGAAKSSGKNPAIQNHRENTRKRDARYWRSVRQRTAAVAGTGLTEGPLVPTFARA